jgi:hypothetical protein
MIVSSTRTTLSATTNSAVFDDGHLRSDTQTSQEFLDGLLSIMRNGRLPEDKGETEKKALVKIFDSVWERVVKVCIRLGCLTITNTLIVISGLYVNALSL